MNDVFIEQQILEAVMKLLLGRVNDMLGVIEFPIPPIEFGKYSGYSVVAPVVSLALCERTEKERIIKIDTYSLTISFTLPETPESELHCYAYVGVVEKALGENPTLGGIADRVIVTGKKYIPPKKPHCGQGWEVVLSLRVTVEGNNYAG